MRSVVDRNVVMQRNLYPYRPPHLHRSFMACHMVNLTFYKFYQVIVLYSEMTTVCALRLT